MQKKKKYWTGVIGIMWVAGLLISGSDSPYMPWVNIIGLILFFISSLMLGKLIQPFEQKHDFPISSSFHPKTISKPVKSQYCICD